MTDPGEVCRLLGTQTSEQLPSVWGALCQAGGWAAHLAWQREAVPSLLSPRCRGRELDKQKNMLLREQPSEQNRREGHSENRRPGSIARLVCRRE